MFPKPPLVILGCLAFVIPVMAIPTAQDTETSCASLLVEQNDDDLLTFSHALTGEIVREQQLPYSFNIELSPDCRFYIGRSRIKDHCEPGLIIWEATTGTERLRRDDFCDTMLTSYPLMRRNDDMSVAIISEHLSRDNMQGGGGQQFFWFPATNQQVSLKRAEGNYGMDADLRQVSWDVQRGWLWSSSYGGVVAFDIAGGEETLHYFNPVDASFALDGTSSYFAFSPDGSQVIVYGQRSARNHTRPGMTVYDIATGYPTAVNIEANGAGEVAMSSDNRYLAMSYTAVRVWDLQNLPENVEDRLPDYRLANPTDTYYIGTIHFLDNNTIEASPGGETVTWTLH